MKNTTSLYFSNEVQNPDLRKISFSEYLFPMDTVTVWTI